MSRVVAQIRDRLFNCLNESDAWWCERMCVRLDDQNARTRDWDAHRSDHITWLRQMDQNVVTSGNKVADEPASFGEDSEAMTSSLVCTSMPPPRPRHHQCPAKV